MGNPSKNNNPKFIVNKLQHLDFDKGLQDKQNKTAFLKIDFLELAKILSIESNFGKLLEATRVSARMRIRKKQTYKKELLRHQTVAAALPESRLERAMWLRWGLHKECGNNPTFIKEFPHIVSYQVPLYNEGPRDGWGKIDAVGIAYDLTPVVIELKADISNESLLRMVLEAVAYGIALQEAWKPRFLQDWKFALNELAGSDKSLINQASLEKLPAELETCHLLCAAPSEYWSSHSEDLKRVEFKAIRNYLSKAGFSISFAKIDFTAQIIDP